MEFSSSIANIDIRYLYYYEEFEDSFINWNYINEMTNEDWIRIIDADYYLNKNGIMIDMYYDYLTEKFEDIEIEDEI